MQAGARDEAEIAEERRLLYVGHHAGARHLALTWSRRPSRFLAELGVETSRQAGAAVPRRELPPAYAR